MNRLMNDLFARYHQYRNALSLANKFTWNDVSIKIDNTSIPNAICLKVSNQKKNLDIQDVNGVIVCFYRYGKVILEQNSDGVKIPLPWYTKNGNSYLPNKLNRKGQPGDTGLLVISRFNPSTETAYLQSVNNESGSPIPNNIPLEIGVAYKIGINWLGQVDDRKMDNYIKYYWLVFNSQGVDLNEIPL